MLLFFFNDLNKNPSLFLFSSSAFQDGLVTEVEPHGPAWQVQDDDFKFRNVPDVFRLGTF